MQASMWDSAVASIPKGATPEPQCPHCQETRLIEQDPITKVYVCSVCAKTWYR